MIKKVLLILSSHKQQDGAKYKIGASIQEFIDAYYCLLDNEVDCIIASPQGGMPPIEEGNSITFDTNAAIERYDKDEALKYKLSHSLQIVN